MTLIDIELVASAACPNSGSHIALQSYCHINDNKFSQFRLECTIWSISLMLCILYYAESEVQLTF